MPAVKGQSFLLGLDTQPSDVEDPKATFELIQVYKAIHNLAQFLDKYTGMTPIAQIDAPSTIFSDTNRIAFAGSLYYPADENILIGDTLNISATGVGLAVAGTATQAQLVALNSVAAGAWVRCTPMGAINAYVGLTPGASYWQSLAAPGKIQSTAPASGVQIVGFALDSTTLWFNPNMI